MRRTRSEEGRLVFWTWMAILFGLAVMWAVIAYIVINHWPW